MMNKYTDKYGNVKFVNNNKHHKKVSKLNELMGNINVQLEIGKNCTNKEMKQVFKDDKLIGDLLAKTYSFNKKLNTGTYEGKLSKNEMIACNNLWNKYNELKGRIKNG